MFLPHEPLRTSAWEAKILAATDKNKIVNSQAPGFKTDGEVQRNFLASSLIFMVYKNIDHRKLPLIWFLQYPGKSMVEWALFSIEKVCALHLTSFLLSVLL